MKREWKAKWIEPVQQETKEEPVFTLQQMFSGEKLVQEPVEERLLPSQCLKKVFQLNADKEIVSAKLVMTAHGIYRAKINGKDVTDALFTPDNTSYSKVLMYQEYDVTALLAEDNVWSVVVADGWYAGRISVNGASAQFGNKLGILGELIVTFADGTTETIGTDEDFFSSTDKYVYSDIFIGEKQDLRAADAEWETSFSTEGMASVTVADYGYENLTEQIGPLVKRKETLAPVAIWQEEESWIVDFGQVIAGRIELTAFLDEGQEISVEHSEVLSKEGKFFNNILGRNKDQTDIFVGRGQEEVLEPDFTFHGFRYAKISGLPVLTVDMVKAYVLYSDMKTTGSFRTSNEKVNRLIDNIHWSQKGNMLSVPTDCPQRERVGWTGDLQVFAPTATFFMDIYDFTRRWLENVMADQLPNGEVVDYSPAPRDFLENPSITGAYSSAGWGDAIILVPWTLYERYGKVDVLAETYPAMQKWHEHCKSSAAGDKEGFDKFIWDTVFHFGDWMFPSYMMGEQSKGPIATSVVTKDVFATAFSAHSSEKLAEIAQLLGRIEEAEGYAAYAKDVKEAFRLRFFENGRLTSDFQGCYVIALAFDMIPQEKEALINRLVTLIEANGNCLDTGFLSVPHLLDVLCENGQEELAKKVFYQEQCPSWFYEVNNGATTIWESWAGIQPNGDVMDFSFNHYAFGCVGDWMVRKIAGLEVKEPGYKEFYIRPMQNSGLEAFELDYDSAQGKIRIALADGQLHVTVPEGSKAFVQVPATSRNLDSAGKVNNMGDLIEAELMSGEYVLDFHGTVMTNL